MAQNSLGVQNALIICRKAFQLTFQKFPMGKLFTMGMRDLDSRADRPLLGQQVLAKLRTIPTMGNFGDAANPFLLKDIPVTLANFRQLFFAFTPDQYNAADYPLFEMAAQPLSQALAIGIIGALGSLVSLSNFGTTTTMNSITQGPSITQASGWTRANTVVPMKTALDNRGVPNMNRYFIWNSTVDQAIQQDQITINSFFNPAGRETYLTGESTPISGLQPYGWPWMPNGDGNLLGYAGTPDALIYVARAPFTPQEMLPGLPVPALIENIVDVNSGFEAQVQFWWDPLTTNINMRIIWFDGMAAGNNNNLVRLVSGAVAGTSGVPAANAVITNPGYGYRNGSGAFAAPTATVTAAAGDSTGSGATAVATINANGAVTGIAITGGTLYTLPPIITLTPSTSGGAGSVVGPASAFLPVAGLT